MKRNLAIILASTLLFMGLANIAAAYDRTVLMENYTNWG